MSNQFWLIFIINCFSLIFGINKNILNLNEQIEDISFKTLNFEFDYIQTGPTLDYYSRINELMDKCDEENYLIGESELLGSKIQIAIALGEEDLIETWGDDYNAKVNDAIKYGMRDKELYYSFLSLQIKIATDGFQFYRDKIEALKRQANINNDHNIEANTLLTMLENVSGEDYKLIDSELETLFSSHKGLKKTYTYIAYQNLKGTRILLEEPEDEKKANDHLDFPFEIRTLLLKVTELVDRNQRSEALSILLEIDNKTPNYIYILNLIVTNYLWLHILEDENKYLEDALKYALQVYELEPYDEGIHYNLSCIYSQKDELDKSLVHLQTSLELGNKSYKWILEDPDLENLRAEIDLHEIIIQYDKGTRASKCFSEALKYAKKIKLSKTEKLAEYRKYMADITIYNHEFKDDWIDELFEVLNSIKNISLEKYLQEIESYGKLYLDNSNFELAESTLTEYIKLTEQFFNKNKQYLENRLNSSISTDERDQTFEELRAANLSTAYHHLADANLALSHHEEFFKNLKNSIHHSEVLGISDFLLFVKHIQLADEYSKIDDSKNSKKHIKKAERSFKRLDSSDSKMLATIQLFDHYFLYSNESYEKRYIKMMKYLNNAIDEAIKAKNFEYQYWFTLRRAQVYSTNNQDQLAYEDFINSYDLMMEHNHHLDYFYTDWRLFESFHNHQRHDLIRKVIEQIFQISFISGDYIDAFEDAVEPMFTYVYKQTLMDDDYELLKSMISKFEKVNKSNFWKLKIKLISWQVELVYSRAHNDLEKTISLIPHYINLRDKVLSENNDELFTTYFWIGRLLLVNSQNISAEEFNKLFDFYEPLHWEYGSGIFADAWFIEFIDYNQEELYTKYIDRILSYPLSDKRLEQKRIHGNVLYNVWGNIVESTKIYEEVLLEAKELGNTEIELTALVELAVRYKDNTQKNLSRRRFFEARELSKRLKNDNQLEIILINMLDGTLYEDDPQFYPIALEYLELSRKLNTYQGQIQSMANFLKYFEHIQEPDSAVHYMLEGFSIKDSVIANHSTLHYLNFLSDCWIYIDNDLTGEIVNSINGWAYKDIKIENPNIQKIVNELVYLKDFDFNTIDEEYKNERPFVYSNTLNQSLILKEYWDDDYIQTDEFNKEVDFFLSVDKSNHPWGLLNAFWAINKRIKSVEGFRGGGDDKYLGFGFKLEPVKESNGFQITHIFLDSPAYKLFELDDILLCNTCNEFTMEGSLEFVSSKIDEADILLNKFARFTILRDGVDTLLVDVMPGEVQPNLYSEYPKQEVTELIEIFLNISDELLNSVQNISSYSAFTSPYREFLIAYPWRYRYLYDEDLTSEGLVKILDRYESISTTNLVNESLNHKENLKLNPLLMSEYNKYSEKINQIQRGLQDKNAIEEELLALKKEREHAYNQLSYFENFTLENSTDKREKNEFSFMDNYDLFDQFDAILRGCSTTYYDNGFFIFNKSEDKTSFFYSSSEVDAEVQIKNLNQTITYTVNNNDENNKLFNALAEMTKTINGTNDVFFEDSIIDQDWLIITEGSTNFFPFELLQFRYKSDTTQYHYLGEAVNITYAPSLSVYAELEKRTNSTQTKKTAILASANPETESSTSYVNNLFALRSEYGSIENVDKEVAAIETIFENKKFFERGYKIFSMNSKNISEKRFKSTDLENAKYIHIAAHGIHDDENPQYSGILLGRDEDDTDDGILQAHEIFPLNLNADLVTLSSCFSGFGEIDPNEGNLGIYRSFLLAGAKSVIISLWNVEDESTSILFSKFYEYLKEGHSKSKSLRLAKMHLKNNPKYSHPFYWAPFILMGES